jgi:hypothetical protein
VTPLRPEAALPELHPTTAEWLASARNYVEFANQTLNLTPATRTGHRHANTGSSR